MAQLDKDDMANAGHTDRVEQHEGFRDVVVEIQFRFRYGFANIGERREMHDGGNVIPRQNFAQGGAVADIAGLERSPADRFTMAMCRLS